MNTPQSGNVLWCKHVLQLSTKKEVISYKYFGSFGKEIDWELKKKNRHPENIL